MAGRPTKYSKEMLARTSEYLISDTPAPNIAELARVLDVTRETLYEWGRVHPEFSDMLKRVLAEQESRLIRGGLMGDFNPTIAKLMLAKHGYHDKHDTTHAGPDGGPVQFARVERHIVDPANTNG